MNDINIGDYVDCGNYGKGTVEDKPTNEYITVAGRDGGSYIHVSDVESIKVFGDDEDDEDDTEMYKPRDKED